MYKLKLGYSVPIHVVMWWTPRELECGLFFSCFQTVPPLYGWVANSCWIFCLSHQYSSALHHARHSLHVGLSSRKRFGALHEEPHIRVWLGIECPFPCYILLLEISIHRLFERAKGTYQNPIFCVSVPFPGLPWSTLYQHFEIVVYFLLSEVGFISKLKDLQKLQQHKNKILWMSLCS